MKKNKRQAVLNNEVDESSALKEFENSKIEKIDVYIFELELKYRYKSSQNHTRTPTCKFFTHFTFSNKNTYY